MATIKDVALLANVSVATVSRVNNNSSKVSPEAKEAVLKAQQELNYHPNVTAKTIAHQNTESIGLIVADISDPYFGAMARAVDEEASKNKYSVLVNNGYHVAELEKKCLDEMIKLHCKAIIAHTLCIDDDTLASYMQNYPNIVLINRILKGFEDRCVALDDLNGAYLAVKHLISNGHKQIAYIKSTHNIPDSKNRYDGYLKALEEAKIPFEPALVVEEEPTAQGGEDGAQALLNSSKPFTAIACYNDMQAAGAMAILMDNDKKVPENISIIGFDNMFISRYLQPRLTTMLNPVKTMAITAVKIALATEEDNANYVHLFTPSLIKRFSVKDLNNF